MKEATSASKRSFQGKIDRSNSEQHLNSHHLFISELQQFLEPFNFPFFTDKLLGILRSYCLAIAEAKFSLEELQINYQPSNLENQETLKIKMTIRHAENLIVKKYQLAIADILAWSMSITPLVQTKRLEIGLLLPTEEPAIIDFLREPNMWQMRGDRYTPLVNLHSRYPHNHLPTPWLQYHFVMRLSQSKKPVGFISFTQISKPSLFTPLVNSKPYEPVMLGYGLSPSYWGQGLMSESLSLFIPWFTSQQNIKEIIAFAEVNNQGSRRILQKLELKSCGLLENAPISPDLRDIYKFVIHYKRY